MSSESTFRVWTIQPLLVWERLQRDRVLEVDYKETYSGPTNDAKFKACPHYRWLIRQLKMRRPGFTGKPLWWAHVEKPDLRWARHCSDAGTKQVRIGLELASHDVFVMPCWAWNEVVFNQYLAVNAHQDRGWRSRIKDIPLDDQLEYPGPIERFKEKSWEQLFHPKLPQRPWRRGWRRGQVAVFEGLRLDSVREVTQFIGTSRLKERVRARMRVRGLLKDQRQSK